MADHATRSAFENQEGERPQPNHRARRGGNSQRARGGRGGRAQNGTSGPENTDSNAARPDATRTEGTAGEQAYANRRRYRRGGDGRGGRGSERARGRGGAMRGAGGHAFGGHLTGSPLLADAPAFMPGQPLQRRDSATTEASSLGPLTRKDSSLRSTAPDIATRTHQDIANELYECSICTNEVRENSKVWSCTRCWTVFHLGCIKKWSKNEGSTMRQEGQPVDEDDARARQWRCPGCNLPHDALPVAYACWCGKELDPKPVSGVPPHSCGQTCAKPRTLPKKCPHPCELTCHAGPCPPCSHMGPVQSCFCGKEAFARRCVETNYVAGWSCGKVCGDIMPCGEHECSRPCHEGLCGACEVMVDARCYCGKESKTMPCTERQEPTRSNDGEWEGVFDCRELCERVFDCGKHVCEKTCHPQDVDVAHCPKSPDVVTRCPCGKTPLAQITDTIRTSCEDPIPECSKQCAKPLLCGHVCRTTCHLGACPPCVQVVDVACRCGRVVNQNKCHQRSDDMPMCTRTCRASLNCGRHECGEQCCPAERKASERLAQRKKPRSLDAPAFDNMYEAEHICTRVCGRPLKCGTHSCPELCHKGPCRSCREAIFEEIACHCGKTVLHPPLPCGTGAPPCRFPCERPKACGHPRVQHNCHSDQEPCPSCPYLMEKVCLCQRKTLKNQPCFRTEVICGEICGKRLRCGSHFCRKPCHRAGECEDATTRCQQPCGDAKKACGHPCEERCHNPSACKEDKPCGSKLIITCDCQNVKTETRCLASRTSEGNRHKKLKCDDECARLERNRQLALALNVDPNHQDNHVPYAATTLQLYQDDVAWGQAQERELRLFAGDDGERRWSSKPIPRNRRAFLHALAEDFGLDSDSLDPEPHRHVFVFKTPRFVKAPMKTLSECVRIRATPVASRTVEQAKLTTDNQPFNGYVLTAPRFALTLEELRAECAGAMAQASTLSFEIEFLPSEEVVFRARPSNANTTIAPAALENLLRNLKSAFLATIIGKKLAGSVSLCALDASLNMLRRETTEVSSMTSGWNRVAARGASPQPPRHHGPAPVGQKSSFTVLTKRKEAEKKKVEKEVVDDWEEEMRKEEAEAQPVDDAAKDDKDPVVPETLAHDVPDIALSSETDKIESEAPTAPTEASHA